MLFRGFALLSSLVALVALTTSLALAQDDRPNQSQVCSVVIDVIVNNQPIQNGGDDVVISGDGNNLSDNQTAVISQYFDISPVVVQDCLQEYHEENGGDDASENSDDETDTDQDTDATDGTTNDAINGGTTDNDSQGEEDDTGTGTTPDTDTMDDIDAGDKLPDTGGLTATGLALGLIFFGFALLSVRLLAALRRS